MKLTFLGTGTSQGIPVIGCPCAVCHSEDPRDRRLRSSIHVESDGFHLQVDTPPEFRLQVLAADILRVDALFVTHTHADHIFGLDDVRGFTDRQRAPIPVYGSSSCMEHLRCVFSYIFDPPIPGTSRPHIELHPIEGAVLSGPFRVVPLPVEHGPDTVYGYRLDAAGRALAYIPDCHHIPPSTLEQLSSLDVMILDALRPSPHPTHLSLPESLALLARIGARRSFVTHLCHRLGHAETERQLPSGVEIPWDGLAVQV